MKTTNERLFQGSVRHQIGLVRLSSGLTKQLVGRLNRAQLRMLDAVQRADLEGGYSEVKINGLLAQVRALSAQASSDIVDELDNDLEQLTGYEIDLTAKALDNAIPDPILGTKALRARLVVTKPGREQAFAAVHARPFKGRILRQYYDAIEPAVYEPVAQTIRQGFADGLTTDTIVRSLKGTRAAKYTDGILQESRRAIERTVRTAVNHTATYAREQTYKANDDVVKAVRWVSTLDTRTSDICQALDGEIFPIDEGPRPPAHLNCRSTTTPVLKSWKELGFDIDELSEGTRASMDGQVPASMTYNEWLAAQSAAVQDDVLGPSRGLLFREGGLTVDKFVDEAGRSLSLDQLRVREGRAFEDADL